MSPHDVTPCHTIQIVQFYDRLGKGEIKYHELVDDIAKDSKHILAQETFRGSARPPTITARIPEEVQKVRCDRPLPLLLRRLASLLDWDGGLQLTYGHENTQKKARLERSKDI